MLRHALAPVVPKAARSLGLPRRLPAAPGGAWVGAPISAPTPTPGPGGVALTFDDGPHPEGTPAVLDGLARAGARATFFVVGEQVRRRPELLADIVAAGHEVALHGDRHRLQLRLSPTQALDDLTRGLAAIEDAIGVAPVWHRPPYGIYSPAGLRAARSAGLRPLLWTRWGKDWRKFTTPARIAARALHSVLPGDVILLHDADFYSAHNSHRRTAAALELILGELRRRKIDTVLPV